jgi:hypothetical protein
MHSISPIAAASFDLSFVRFRCPSTVSFNERCSPCRTRKLSVSGLSLISATAATALAVLASKALAQKKYDTGA